MIVANIGPFCKVSLNTVILMPETFTVNYLHLAEGLVTLLVVILLYGKLPIGDGVQLVLVFKSMDRRGGRFKVMV